MRTYLLAFFCCHPRTLNLFRGRGVPRRRLISRGRLNDFGAEGYLADAKKLPGTRFSRIPLKTTGFLAIGRLLAWRSRSQGPEVPRGRFASRMIRKCVYGVRRAGAGRYCPARNAPRRVGSWTVDRLDGRRSSRCGAPAWARESASRSRRRRSRSSCGSWAAVRAGRAREPSTANQR